MADQINPGQRGQQQGASPDLGKIADDLRDSGGRMGQAAVEQAQGLAEGLAERGKQAGLAEVEQVTEAAARVADTLQDQAPMLADYVRDAACRIDDMGRALRERSVGDLLSSATEYGRQQPLLFFAGAAVLGFALTRFVRSGLPPAADGSSGVATGNADAVQAERDAVTKSTGIDV